MRCRIQQAQRVDNPSLPDADVDPLPHTLPDLHHHISEQSRFALDVYQWTGDHDSDPALNNFVPKLYDHLLHRLFPHTDNLAGKESANVVIRRDKIYRHAIMRINYTTYDVRREQDTISPTSRPDIMIFEKDEATISRPYDYARVIGIFHVEASYKDTSSCSTGEEPKRIEFLWVRRLRPTSDSCGPFSNESPPKVSFLDTRHPEAFDFIDPSQVIRGIHLIPAFDDNDREVDLMVESVALAPSTKETGNGWRTFYINM